MRKKKRSKNRPQTDSEFDMDTKTDFKQPQVGIRGKDEVRTGSKQIRIYGQDGTDINGQIMIETTEYITVRDLVNQYEELKKENQMLIEEALQHSKRLLKLNN